MMNNATVGKCVVCMELTECYVTCNNTPSQFTMFMCDECYYAKDDPAILPVPFGCLFDKKTWDMFQ